MSCFFGHKYENKKCVRCDAKEPPTRDEYVEEQKARGECATSVVRHCMSAPCKCESRCMICGNTYRGVTYGKKVCTGIVSP